MAMDVSSLIRRAALATGAGTYAGIIQAQVGGQKVSWDWVVVAIVTVALVLATDLWYANSDSFPQWFYDPPHLDIEVATGGDLFVEDWIEGLHLSVKNRPQRGRKTRRANDAWVHAIVEGPDGRFEPQLMLNWGVTTQPQVTADLVAGIRVNIPFATKAFKKSETATSWENSFSGTLGFFKTYLMDRQFHMKDSPKRRVLGVGTHDIALWMEYDGGKTSRRRHFQLIVAKGDGSRNQLVAVPTLDGR
jgi:hypothetical protein